MNSQNVNQYYLKYTKYKTKYLNLKKNIEMNGGNTIDITKKLTDNIPAIKEKDIGVINMNINEFHESLQKLVNYLCCCHANINEQLKNHELQLSDKYNKDKDNKNNRIRFINIVLGKLNNYIIFLKNKLNDFERDKINLSIQTKNSGKLDINNRPIYEQIIFNNENIKSIINKLSKVYATTIENISSEYNNVIQDIYLSANIDNIDIYKLDDFENKKSITCIDEVKCTQANFCKVGTQSSCTDVVYNMPDCYLTSYFQQINRIKDILKRLNDELNKYANLNSIFQVNLIDGLLKNMDNLNTIKQQIDEYIKRHQDLNQQPTNIPKTINQKSKKSPVCQIL